MRIFENSNHLFAGHTCLANKIAKIQAEGPKTTMHGPPPPPPPPPVPPSPPRLPVKLRVMARANCQCRSVSQNKALSRWLPSTPRFLISREKKAEVSGNKARKCSRATFARGGQGLEARRKQ
jgi:hypothetical protein